MCEREKNTTIFLGKFNLCNECLQPAIIGIDNWVNDYLSSIKEDYPEEAEELYKQKPITLKHKIEWVEDVKKMHEKGKIIQRKYPELTPEEVVKKVNSTKTFSEAERNLITIDK